MDWWSHGVYLDLPAYLDVFSLKNKIAFVTGAASGIGAAIAETFAHAGAGVWVADRDEANGRAVAERIGGKFLSLSMSPAKAVARRLHKLWGRSMHWRTSPGSATSERCSTRSQLIWTGFTR